MRVKMTSVLVEDPIAAYKFYTEILGFKSYMYMPEGQLAIVVSPEDENGVTLLLEPLGIPEARVLKEKVYDMGLPCIIMGCANVEDEYHRLKAKGVVFKQQPTTNEWGTSAVFDDTCGNYIQIHQDD